MGFKRRISVFILLIAGIPAWAEVNVKLEKDAVVEGVKSRKKFLAQSGTAFEWDATEPLIVSQEENVPLIIVPVDFKGDLNVKAISLRDIVGAKIDKKVQETLSDVLSKVVEIQKLSRKGNYSGAYERYLLLKNRYPDIAFLDFIGAGLSLLKGDRVGARDLAARASASHPEYADGQRFVKELEAKN